MGGLLFGQMEYIKEKSQILCPLTGTNCFTNTSSLVPKNDALQKNVRYASS